ncbi:RHS repeat-associated core domain-containing protein [Pseudidiomarina indica]|uniref:RHS repeat-associated core domain-containing protein n=2 Tax=Pseudidiomarina indica TaxID=1159017 RepID=A0A1G6DLA9_9GAMM|nr:RHS repeat-associated core domain-containing protein [Pseudidiomarina indica]
MLPPTEQGFTGHRQMDALGIVHMKGRIYDPTLGRFLQADPFVQEPKNSQNYNRYSYVLNNPMSYTDPSGYFFSKLWETIKPIIGAVVVAVLSVYCQACATYFASSWYGAATAGAIAGAAGAAANGGNIFTGALRGAVAAAAFYGVGQVFEPGSFGHLAGRGLAGGVMSDLYGGKFGHGFWSAGLGNASSGQYSTNASTQVIVSAVVGGTISKLTGGKFANGAFNAAFARMLKETGNYYQNQATAKANRSKVLELSSMTGESSSLFDGKVEVAWWGPLAGEVSADDLASVKDSLDDIFATDSGKEMLGKLSTKSPLKIILNNIGENFGRLNGNIMTVDLNTNLNFYNLASEAMPLTRFSLTRIIAHEMGHAVMGLADTNNANVLFTDKIMSEIDGTQRQQYSNACTLNPQGACI